MGGQVVEVLLEKRGPLHSLSHGSTSSGNSFESKRFLSTTSVPSWTGLKTVS